MLIQVKILQGRECDIEVSSRTSIMTVKEIVSRELNIPVSQQKLVFKGKTLADEMCLSDYNMIEGSKVHLFVISDNSCPSSSSSQSSNSHSHSHQESNILVDTLRQSLQKDYSKSDCEKIVDEFSRHLRAMIYDLSLDDIERLAKTKLGKA